MADKIFVSDEIFLAPISHGDVKRLQTLADEVGLSAKLGDEFPYPYTVQDAEWFITFSQEQLAKGLPDGEHNLGIYVDEEYAGNLGRSIKKQGRWKHNFHLGYRLGKEYRGKGYMTRIVDVVCSHIFSRYADCHRIYAIVYSLNPGSKKVLEKNGFRLEGTLQEAVCVDGVFYDEWILGKLRAEHHIK